MFQKSVFGLQLQEKCNSDSGRSVIINFNNNLHFVNMWKKLVHVPKVIQFAENLLLFDVAARVAAKWSLAHAAGQAAHMPAQVVNLKQRHDGWTTDKRGAACALLRARGAAQKPQ